MRLLAAEAVEALAADSATFHAVALHDERKDSVLELGRWHGGALRVPSGSGRCIVVCDGLTGLADAVGAVWPRASCRPVSYACCLYANPAFATMHACPMDVIEKTRFSVFYSPAEWNGPVQSLMSDALSTAVGRAEVTRRRLDGTTFAAHVTLSLLRDAAGTLIGRILCVQDITARKQLEAQLHRAAFHDPLTDLPNRRLLLDRLEHALAVAERAHTAVAVLFIDLDGFKAVNVIHGHDAGDQLLVRSSDRLREYLRAADTLARLGGDEFVVLLEGVTDSGQAATNVPADSARPSPTIQTGPGHSAHLGQRRRRRGRRR